jgi:hypothetical protein
MSRNKPDLFAERLREEGLAGTPAFSPELHARVMEALRAKGLETHEEEIARRSRWRLILTAAAPLAVAAAVGVVAWIAIQPAEVKPVDRSMPVAVEMPSVMPREIVEPVHEKVAVPTAEAWQEGKYGYLDKDARKLAIFVASQIPGVPREE